MHNPRFIRPIHVSEFAALFLKVTLMEEIGRVAVAQEEARDRFDRDEWAMLTVKLFHLGDHLNDIEAGMRLLGPAPREVLQEYAQNIHREGNRLPRSRANGKKWDAHQKEARKVQREHVENVRAEMEAERTALVAQAKAAWGAPAVTPSDG